MTATATAADPTWSAIAAAAADADAQAGAAAPGEAPTGDGAPDQAGADPAAPPAPSNRDTVAGMLALFRELACGLLQVESPRRTLDDAAIARVADACGPVADKYGLQLARMFGGYELELTAALVTVPIVVGAARALSSELADKKAAKKAAKGEGDGEQADQADAKPSEAPALAQGGALERAPAMAPDAPGRWPAGLVVDPFRTRQAA